MGEQAPEPETIGVGAFKNGWHVTTQQTGLRWKVVIQPIDSEDEALDAALFVCNALEDLEDANDVELIEALKKSVEDDQDLRELTVEPTNESGLRAALEEIADPPPEKCSRIVLQQLARKALEQR